MLKQATPEQIEFYEKVLYPMQDEIFSIENVNHEDFQSFQNYLVKELLNYAKMIDFYRKEKEG